MNNVNVTPAQLHAILSEDKYNGIGDVRYSKQLQENNEVTQITQARIYMGAEYENLIRSRENKEGLESREIGSANYTKQSKIAAIYKNDGSYAVIMLALKNSNKTFYLYKGKEYTKKELQPLNILPDSFFAPKSVADKRFSEENDFEWNVLKLFNIDSITFNKNTYVVIAKQTDIKLSELLKKVHKLKKEMFKAVKQDTKDKKLKAINDLKKEINLYTLGANKEIIESILNVNPIETENV